MRIFLPLFALLLGACSTSSHSPSMAIDDADAWQAICKDGTRGGPWWRRGSARIIAVLPCGRISQEPHGWQRKPPNSVIQAP